MSYIAIENITHCYSTNQKALSDVNYHIKKGEFFSLLGPSGCGKSTLLNIIGGFLDPTEGHISIGGVEVLDLPPYKRNISTVFQSYALFPHMSVYDNVAYGLKVKKKDKAYIEKRVKECLALVHLSEYEKRMPHELSGGQQQRVAIARALANDPDVLLLDEPMGNLDAKLRKEMQIEIRAIQQRTGITTIMVTHDQEEAMTMSDRIGIMRNGVVQQVGTPQEVYSTPSNSFVAEFLGKINMTHAVPNADGCYESTEWVKANGEPVRFANPLYTDGSDEAVERIMAIRPENILSSFEPIEGYIPVVANNVVYIGNSLRIMAGFEGKGEITLDVSTCQMEQLPVQGQMLYINWRPQDVLCVKDVGEKHE